jgi:hypothetical protein
MAIRPEKSSASAAQDFALEKYKLDRAHELELNRATVTYEHEVLKMLAYLNGGAAFVYIGFIGAQLKDKGAVPSWAASYAVASWSAGLLVTAVAIWAMYESQVGFTQAYHNRRRAEEKRQFHGVVAYLNVTDPCKTMEEYELYAGICLKKAKRRKLSAKLLGLLAILLFCLGLATALYAVTGNIVTRV